jgi:hypothetical protein
VPVQPAAPAQPAAPPAASTLPAAAAAPAPVTPSAAPVVTPPSSPEQAVAQPTPSVPEAAPPVSSAPAAPARSALLRERVTLSDNRLAESSLRSSAQRHHGVAMRLTTALGFGNANRDRRRGELQVSGFDAGIGIDIGGTPIENLVVYGRAVGFAFDHASSSDSPNAGSAFVGMLGAGARYHFMPIDWYAGGTLGLAGASVTNDQGTAQNTNPGYGLELETGKSWWAGAYRDSWTVSLGLRFAYVRSGSVSTGNSTNTDPWVATAFSLVFATAYN